MGQRPLWGRGVNLLMVWLTVVSEFLLLVAHCTLQSLCDYSNGIAESHVPYPIGVHVRLHHDCSVFNMNWDQNLRNNCSLYILYIRQMTHAHMSTEGIQLYRSRRPNQHQYYTTVLTVHVIHI